METVITKRDNLLSVLRRRGYLLEEAPVELSFCPALEQKFAAYAKENGLPENTWYRDYFGVPYRELPDSICPQGGDVHRKYYGELRYGTFIDQWGVAFSPGSDPASHLTRMLHPMERFDSVEQVQAYAFPVPCENGAQQRAAADRIKAEGYAAYANMPCTIWERAWYLRGMENLMADMLTDAPMAEAVFEKVTLESIRRAERFAAAGADILHLGDDVGMQRTIMMSETLYREWIQPRLRRVIDAAKAVKPDIIVTYHSCGYVEPLIPNLIEAGIDVLNPVQPECMDFARLHAQYGDRLSFYGTIGTQTTMPYGTPEEVRAAVFRNLNLAGERGGLWCTPTHVLEPEVPMENILAYISACREYRG